jgi:A/G-specific adenine glycosylase
LIASSLEEFSPFTFRGLRVFRGAPILNSKNKNQKLVPLLLAWFATNARDLPWRRTRDPYAIWVSEIMLQQTQVKTVIPYWERWMRELPTIESLAQASTDKIHKLWEGLGYYTRVRNMQKAAKQIITSQSAVAADVSPLHLKTRMSQSRLTSAATIQRGFPTNFDAVLALPGIGRYTAGAICSIAFNQPTPILDGNVIRVLTRIHGIKTDPREKQTNAQLWQLAEKLVIHASRPTPHAPPTDSRTRTKDEDEDDQSCSHLNQSLMELGALICTPRTPSCAACPVQKLCVAHQENLQAQLPNLGKRVTATERRFIAFVVERDGKYLVHQRPEGVVNAHLWEFPNVEVGAAPGKARHSGRAAASQTQTGAQRTDAPYQQSDFRITSEKPLHVVKHSITRYRITLEAWRAELASDNGAPVPAPARSKSAKRNTPGRRSAFPGVWRTLAECESLAFTSAHKKIRSKLMLTAD